MADRHIVPSLLLGLGAGLVFLTTLSALDNVGEYASRAYPDAAYHAHFLAIGKEAATLVFGLAVAAYAYLRATARAGAALALGILVTAFVGSISNRADFENVGPIAWLFTIAPGIAIGMAAFLWSRNQEASPVPALPSPQS